MTGKPLPGEAAGHGRVHRSDPGFPSWEQLRAEYDRLSRQLYVELRDGTVNPEVAFDLAALRLRWGPPDPLLTALAEQSAEGHDVERITDLVRQVLALSFTPGFDPEPEFLQRLERALAVAEADLRAAGITDPVRLIVTDGREPPRAHAEFRGIWDNGDGIHPEAGAGPLPALVAVAGDLQDSVMEAMCDVWPVCPEHNLGAHAREAGSTAVWWCRSGGGHVIAAIGRLASAEGPC